MIYKRMVIRGVIPIFLVALIFFALILELIDLFANLPRYLNLEIDVKSILKVGLYYLPKCLSFSVPVGLLFAVSYTLGNLYSSNQLIAILGSGTSLFSFVFPLILLGAIFSIGSFYFEEHLVIDTYKQKNSLQTELLKQKAALSNANVSSLSADNSTLYIADYYNDNAKTLSGLTLLNLERGRFSRRLEAEWAEWKEDRWTLHNVRVFLFDLKSGEMSEEYFVTFSDESLSEPPETFQKTSRNLAEMRNEEALLWLRAVRRAGTVQYAEALTDYYRRFSFAVTPFIVALIAASLGGRFKKNILLMSLLSSLCVSVLYYVLEMVTVLLAKQGYISPLTGALFPAIVFLFFGFVLFRFAPT
jgi:lipopolysaccharide export system permease protein